MPPEFYPMFYPNRDETILWLMVLIIVVEVNMLIMILRRTPAPRVAPRPARKPRHYTLRPGGSGLRIPGSRRDTRQREIAARRRRLVPVASPPRRRARS